MSKSSGDINIVQLGREICFIFLMFSVRSLCSSLRDIFGFNCGSSVMMHAFHSLSSSIMCSWWFSSMPLRCTPLLFS